MNKTKLILLLALFIFSCKSEDPIEIIENQSPPIVTNPDPDDVPIITPTGNENYLNLESDYIFDQSKLPTFELNLPIASLATLDNDPAAEEYVEGSLL